MTAVEGADGHSGTAGLEERPVPRIASFGELRDFLREDYRTNKRNFWSPGFQALAAYRLGVWVKSIRWRLLRGPVRLLHRFLSFFVRNFYGIELQPTTVVGRRLEIAHQHGIVIHPRAVIGDDCLLRQGVSLGGLRPGPVSRAPTLGNRVEVGAGAMIIGRIRIGDDVVIGPNAVVTTHVPPGSIVASPPSRIMTPPPRRAAAGAQPDAVMSSREPAP
jgi:serine O-acetyltransferase